MLRPEPLNVLFLCWDEFAAAGANLPFEKLEQAALKTKLREIGKA